MDNSFFTISNFSSEKQYIKLKRYFLSADINEVTINEGKLNLDNPSIYVADFKSVNQDYPYVQIDVKKEFVKDFIIPGIKNIHQNELLEFKNQSFKRSLFTKQLKEGYALEIKNELKGFEMDISKFNHLPKGVEKQLLNEIKLINSEIRLYINNPYPKLINKLNVKSKRAIIEAIFYLIYKDKKFDKATIADVGRVIDSCFRYEESSGNYKDILRANSHLAELEAMGEPSKLVQKQLKKELEKLIKLLS